MTTPMPDNGDTPELDQLEHETRTQLDRHLEPARREAERPTPTPAEVPRANNRVLNRIRSARAAISETVQRAVTAAVSIGADDGSREAPPPPGDNRATRPNPMQTSVLTEDLNLREDVRIIISQHGMRVETGPARLTPMQLATQAGNSFWSLATTNINRTYNRGRAWYATLYGYDLRLFTREDERVCDICSPLHDIVLGSQERFEAEPDWEMFDGHPPFHPYCRCFTQVIRRGILG